MTIDIRSGRRELFERLFREYVVSYPDSKAGKKHVALYASTRADVRHGYERLMKAKASGEEITELALMRLLPHAGAPFNRERGA